MLHTRTHARTHTYTYTHVHTCIHTYTQIHTYINCMASPKKLNAHLAKYYKESFKGISIYKVFVYLSSPAN